jgi:signal transduction histidine kinase
MVASETHRAFTTREIDALALVAAQTSDAIGQLREATAMQTHVVHELHDTVSQTLTLLTFTLEELLGATTEEPSRSLALLARSHAGEALRQLRRLMDHAGADESLLVRIQRLFEELARTGVEVHLSGTLRDETLPDRVSECLLSIAHEALMNVRRHAGARRITIVFRRARDAAWLVVTDDGRGFSSELRPAPPSGGRGLSIMRERAGQLGGVVTVKTCPAVGTSITARIPLSR